MTRSGRGPFEPAARPKLDLERMCEDVARCAELAGAPFDRAALWPVLDAYRPFFTESVVSFVTSTKPAATRRLHARYIELVRPHDAYATALQHGFLVPRGHFVDAVLPGLRSTLPVQGYGVDVDAASGFAKLWVFLRDVVTMEALGAMPYMPPSVARSAALFGRHRLSLVSLVGVDFQHRTANAYFMLPPGWLSAPAVAALLDELGLQVPRGEVLEHCARAPTIYPTFSWDSGAVERVCFGIPARAAAEVPVDWDPLIARYVAGAPILHPRRPFIYSVTPGRASTYVKIENDYGGSMAEALLAGSEAVAHAFAGDPAVPAGAAAP